jgi:hypothetical protein
MAQFERRNRQFEGGMKRKKVKGRMEDREKSYYVQYITGFEILQ